MTSAIIREWIFGFLQAETSTFIGLGCTGGDARPLCPTAPIAPPVSATPSSLGCAQWVLAHAPPGRVCLPPQRVGAALLLLTRSTACSEPARDMQPRSLLTSLLGSLGIPNSASLTAWLCAHRRRHRQLSNCIRPTFAVFSLPQLDFI